MGSVRGLFGWVVLLTLATGLIHLYIGVDFLLEGPYADAVIDDPTASTAAAAGIVFIGMAIPYLVGLALILRGVRPHLWLRVGAGYTGLAPCPVGSCRDPRQAGIRRQSDRDRPFGSARGATPAPR